MSDPENQVQAAKKVVAKKAPAKRAPAKAALAKKAVAKKTAAKKAVTKKAPAKKSVAKQTTRNEGPAKKPVTKREPAPQVVEEQSLVGPLKVNAVELHSIGERVVVDSTLTPRQLNVSLPKAAVVAQDGKPQRTIQQFVANVLGSEPELTNEQVAELADVPLDVTRALWRAMGFADAGSAAAFSTADVEALKALMSLVEAGYISYEESIEMVRAIGQHTARLAEWQGNIIARSLLERGVMSQQGVLESTDIGPLLRDSEAYQPVLEALMVYSWRRQMAHNAMRAAAVADAGPDARTDAMTVGFADLAGFTRLSRQIPEEDLSILVKQFESVSADVVAAHGSRLIKTLGDEVLFVHESPRNVAKIALELHEAHRESEDVPRMRIGLGTGSVLLRMGDVFGTTVNRASRLTAMAKPGSTFVDAATFEALVEDRHFAFKAVRPRPARGFGLLRAWSLNRSKSK